MTDLKLEYMLKMIQGLYDIEHPADRRFSNQLINQPFNNTPSSILLWESMQRDNDLELKTERFDRGQE